ncbi:winged helix DNA-binding domain-containing protein [Spongiactinospora sp. TRM90649]|uniref:winged helix DNA-binding domain-containing protein n=1 Tax=Spongiactinospora sp. TRM90649 TaxID=3031114 RepID=UPI0023F941E7|nr:winged helix DNA-binding domain-containing protein [Spongiactinospora sp. TRM90649]MDF5754735.1 winged helix DNA-binding domain-containing protein [Spongiactinospora sp. TRM90649]
MDDVLSRRAINRATLARQLLLRRAEPAEFSVLDAVEHLGGLQAQTPHTWYTGLWSRLTGFRPQDAAELLTERRAVRVALMRGTIHLVSADDCMALRPLVQPVIERGTMGAFRKRLAGVDPVRLAATARAHLAERPLTFAELGKLLAEEWPEHDAHALGQGARAWLTLVQVPPRGLWGRSGPVAHTTAETWLGRDDVPPMTPETMVRRYLAAFGPASVKDVQQWSGLTRLSEIVAGLGDLVTFRDEHGVRLFDLPGAPRPDADTPAPARFLYDFDNLLLSHADRTRVVTDAFAAQRYDPHGWIPNLFLIDGFTAGDWRVTRERQTSVLTIRPWAPLRPADVDELTKEGGDLLGFLAPPGDAREIRIGG